VSQFKLILALGGNEVTFLIRSLKSAGTDFTIWGDVEITTTATAASTTTTSKP